MNSDNLRLFGYSAQRRDHMRHTFSAEACTSPATPLRRPFCRLTARRDGCPDMGRIRGLPPDLRWVVTLDDICRFAFVGSKCRIEGFPRHVWAIFLSSGPEGGCPFVG